MRAGRSAINCFRMHNAQVFRWQVAHSFAGNELSRSSIHIGHVQSAEGTHLNSKASSALCNAAVSRCREVGAVGAARSRSSIAVAITLMSAISVASSSSAEPSDDKRVVCERLEWRGRGAACRAELAVVAVACRAERDRGARRRRCTPASRTLRGRRVLRDEVGVEVGGKLGVAFIGEQQRQVFE